MRLRPAGRSPKRLCPSPSTILFCSAIIADHIVTLSVKAGVHTPSGNLDLREPTADYGSDLPFTVKVNDNPPLNWTIPYDSSSSCVERSGIACYNIRNLWVECSSRASDDLADL
jgi:hypothetical protein